MNTYNLILLQTMDLNLENLDSFIENGIKKPNIPGLGIGIVQDGKTVYLKGFGYSVYSRIIFVLSTMVFLIVILSIFV